MQKSLRVENSPDRLENSSSKKSIRVPSPNLLMVPSDV